MSTSSSSSGAGSVPCVLVVADPGRMNELADALEAPLPQGRVDVLRSSGGDDTIDLFESCSPHVVVLTATLEEGDAKSLIEAIREMVPRDHVVIVLVGDDGNGVVRTALDAIDMKPDRFVSRPLAAKALRFAVQSGLENVARALGETVAGNGKSANSERAARASGPISSRGVPTEMSSAETSGAMRVLRDNDSRHGTLETAAGSSPLILIGPRPSVPTGIANSGNAELIGDDEDSDSVNISTDDIDDHPQLSRTETPVRGSNSKSGPVAGARAIGAPTVGRAPTDRGIGLTGGTPAEGPLPKSGDAAPRAPMRPRTPSGPMIARWEALADSIAHEGLDDEAERLEDRAAPLPPIEMSSRRKSGTNPEFTPVPPVQPWRPGTTSALPTDEDYKPPSREPTLIIADPPPLSPVSSGSITVASVDPHSSLITPIPSLATPPPAASSVEQPAERWSQPVLLSALIDRSRDSSLELLAHIKDDLAPNDIDDNIIVGRPQTMPPPTVMRTGQLDALESLMEPIPPPGLGLETHTTAVSPAAHPQPALRPSSPLFGRASSNFGGSGTSPGFTSGAGAAGSDPSSAERPAAGRDFARQLRAKMSQMAQRLFQGDSPAEPQNVDLRPRHDHHTEIDLAALGEELVLGGGVTEIESRGGQSSHNEPPRSPPGTSPGSWDTAVRERGLPDTGEIVRGTSDAPLLLARMFSQAFTGRVGFRRDEVEKVVYFDQGRPVFASSNQEGDRMGELLVREGKITASQYERCQVHAAQSGRRMGEILVDFGYLKRRELLPAVRRHVEDILYSLFSWDSGIYHMTPEPTASAERIRLSRHPASLVLEGIRRKLDRTTLEKMLGASSTVIEIPDRDRLSSIINTTDLAGDERTALGGFDGQADLAQIARNTGVDVADVLPLAWGLVALGLATARRTEPAFTDESTALVGETDLAIDRERVRARWQLVTDADYFALLGVRRDATAFEIRRAYQAARRDFAADCFPGDLRRELARELEDIACVLDEAFRVLRDDRLRVAYLANLVE